MKKTRLTISGLLALFVFAGCGNDGNLSGVDNDAPVAIQVTSGIQTRAYDATWEAGDAIGIFMLNTGTTTVDTYVNNSYTTTGNGAFTPSAVYQTVYLPTDGSERDFIAYYPYRSNISSGENKNIYAIDLTQQNPQKNIDLMASTTDQIEGVSKTEGIDKNDPTVKFRFYHKLSKVYMTIKTGDGFKGDNSELEGLTVKLTGQRTAGTYDVLTGGAVSVTTGDAKDIILLTAADGQSAEAIVMPSDDYTGMQFVFSVVGHNDYVWPLRASKATKFEEGKKYVYDITIHKTGLEVHSTIEDWAPGNGDGGETGEAY